jgi:hypothetical protein
VAPPRVKAGPQYSAQTRPNASRAQQDAGAMTIDPAVRLVQAVHKDMNARTQAELAGTSSR